MSYRDPSIVGQPLTPTEEKVWSAKQSNPGMTQDQLAELVGYASGTVGNAVRAAETKLGIRPPMGQGSGTTRSRTVSQPKVRGLADTIREGYRVAQATVAQLRQRMTEAQEDADQADEARFSNEQARLQVVVDEAQAKLDAFVGMTDEQRDAWMDSRRQAAQARFDTVSKEIGDNLDQAEQVLDQFVTEAERLEIDLDEDNAPTEADSTETEDEPEADEAEATPQS